MYVVNDFVRSLRRRLDSALFHLTCVYTMQFIWE